MLYAVFSDSSSHEMPPSPTCPCGSGRSYPDCCGPLHAGNVPAANAEALMRSRYCAFVLGDEDYLLQTWHPDTRPENLHLAEEPVPKWLGLAIKRHEATGADQAVVEFVARYKIAGRAFRLHETSRFLRVDGLWFYMDGEVR